MHTGHLPPIERDALQALDGVDVHHSEPGTGRIIATIEARTIRGEADILQDVQALPEVGFARLVHHHFEDDELLRDRAGQASHSVPEFLKD